MKPSGFHRLHTLRMQNDETGQRMEEMRPRFEAIGNRHEDGTAPRAVTAYQLFQTPPELAARLAALLDLQPGARVLEPSAGLGRLLDAVAIYKPAQVVAMEIDRTLSGELFKQDRRGVQLVTRDFTTEEPENWEPFDAVAMNPPFHMRADIRHILHAAKFLKPGGRLAALCMSGPFRQSLLRPLAATWEPIPAGTFKGEGTNVPTILLTIQK